MVWKPSLERRARPLTSRASEKLQGGRPNIRCTENAAAWPVVQSGIAAVRKHTPRRVLAGMRNRVILGVRGGFLKERQEPAVRSALWAHDRS